jgi:hypothetical protein
VENEVTERRARKLVGFGTIDESLSSQESRSEQKADTTGQWLENLRGEDFFAVGFRGEDEDCRVIVGPCSGSRQQELNILRARSWERLAYPQTATLDLLADFVNSAFVHADNPRFGPLIRYMRRNRAPGSVRPRRHILHTITVLGSRSTMSYRNCPFGTCEPLRGRPQYGCVNKDSTFIGSSTASVWILCRSVPGV